MSPFCPCTVLDTVATRLLTNQGESRPEADIAICIASIVIQIEGEQAAAGTIIVIAATKGQTLKR